MATKLSLAPVVAAHHRTLSDVRSGRLRFQDFLGLYGPPVLASGALGLVELISPTTLDLGSPAVAAAVTAATGLLAGFLFALAVTILERAIDLEDSEREASEAITDAALRLRELSANTCFAAMVSALTTAVFIVAAVVPRLAELLTIAGLGGVVLLGTTGSMVVRRVSLETDRRLRQARTNSSTEPVEL